MSKYIQKVQIGNYKVEVQDYRYRSRPPVAVRVSGTVEGECRNSFGEPCYFYQSAEAMSFKEGMETARAIVRAQQARNARQLESDLSLLRLHERRKVWQRMEGEVRTDGQMPVKLEAAVLRVYTQDKRREDDETF